MNINLNQWAEGEVNLEDYTFNLNLPLEFQTKELEAEIKCSICSLRNDCRKCQYYEFSLLYKLEGK